MGQLLKRGVGPWSRVDFIKSCLDWGLPGLVIHCGTKSFQPLSCFMKQVLIYNQSLCLRMTYAAVQYIPSQQGVPVVVISHKTKSSPPK